MGFRNPIVLADEVTSGNFAGQYTISGLMIVGNPNAQHVAIGTDALGSDGIRLYGVDGVTPQVDLQIGAVPTVIAGTIPNGPFVKIGTTGYGIGFGISSLTGDIDQDTNGPGVFTTSNAAGPLGRLSTAIFSPKYVGSSSAANLSLFSATRDGTVEAFARTQVLNSTGLSATYEEVTPTEWHLAKTLGGTPFVKFSATGGTGQLSWDGATFASGNTYPITMTNPGDLRMPRGDGSSPGIVTSAGSGGLRLIVIPGSSEVSVDITAAGIVNLGNGQTSIGGAVNVRNGAAQALTQHTFTVQTRPSQSGDVIRAVNSNNSAVIGNLTSFGRFTVIDAVQPGNSTTAGGRLFSGSGAPSTTLGSIGDFYFRTDTPATVNQRLYTKTAAAVWTAIL